MADLEKQIALVGTVGREKREITLNEDMPIPDSTPSGLAITANVDEHNLHITFNEDVALSVTAGNQKRNITFKELTLSNNLALESLVKLLVDKKIIDIKDLQATMDLVRKERYQTPTG
jgi:hypothetical protein